MDAIRSALCQAEVRLLGRSIVKKAQAHFDDLARTHQQVIRYRAG